jgi:DNA-binding HxlR family transcriptional regulator
MKPESQVYAKPHSEVAHGAMPPVDRRFAIRHGRPRATMVASTGEIHQFLAYLWGDAEDLPRHVPRFSLDIWLDIMLTIRNIVPDDLEKHRYMSIKTRIKNPYPDNVFSWILNQLVELGFLRKEKEMTPEGPGRSVRYFLTAKGSDLVKMFESVVEAKRMDTKDNRFFDT